MERQRVCAVCVRVLRPYERDREPHGSRHDYDSRLINVGDLEAIHFLEQAFDYFLYAYERLYCFDFPGAYDRVTYAVNIAG
jgi:hypothetical protein